MTDESIACCPDERTSHEPPDTAVNEESLQQNIQELPIADEVSVARQQSLSLSEYLGDYFISSWQVSTMSDGILKNCWYFENADFLILLLTWSKALSSIGYLMFLW